MKVTTTEATTPTSLPAVKATCTCHGAAIIDARAAARLDNKGLHAMILTANDRRLTKALARQMGPWAA
jgi:hypothetical protein